MSWEDVPPFDEPTTDDGGQRMTLVTGPDTSCRLEPAEVLAEVAHFIARHVVLPSLHYAVAVTLWVAHTHRLDVADSTPRLAFMAPEKGCGKSRAQEVLESLTPRPMRTSTVTTSVLFRTIGSETPPTVYLDEVDTVWTGKGTAEELRALVNAGHRRGSDALRMTGEGSAMKVTRFSTFAPVCLAGIGDLPATIADRSILVPMRRRLDTELVERWRFREGMAEGSALRMRLATMLDALEIPAEPTIPDTIADRAADVWEPLLGIAEAIGGDWYRDALAACEVITASQPESISAGVRLLTDIRDVWTPGATAMPSQTLCDELANVDDGPWGGSHDREPITPRRLAYMLKRYGVTPTRTAHERRYLQADFADPWARYCQ